MVRNLNSVHLVIAIAVGQFLELELPSWRSKTSELGDAVFAWGQLPVAIGWNPELPNPKRVHVKGLVVCPWITREVVRNVETNTKLIDHALTKGVHPACGQVGYIRVHKHRQVRVDIIPRQP